TQLGQSRVADSHPNGMTSSYAYSHLADAFDLRELLSEDVIGSVVDAAQGHRFRGRRDNHDGCVSRINLAVDRRVRQVGRELSTRGVDGRLDVPRRRINVAAQIELEHDLGGAELAGRGHLGDAGNAPKLAFQRGGD